MGNLKSLNNLANMYRHGYENIKKDIPKAIQLLEKAIKMGDVKPNYNLGVIFENGDVDFKIEKDIDRSCFLFFTSFSKNHSHSKKKFLNLINNHQHLIFWRKEYHIYWNSKEEFLLNRKILLILLISKYRKSSSISILNNIFIKGITFQIIQYLAHFCSN
jgi:hypothetical protein